MVLSEWVPSVMNHCLSIFFEDVSANAVFVGISKIHTLHYIVIFIVRNLPKWTALGTVLHIANMGQK